MRYENTHSLEAVNAKRFLDLPKSEQDKWCQLHPRETRIQRKALYNDDIPSLLKDAKEFAEEYGKTVDDVALEHYAEDQYGSLSSGIDLILTALETDVQYHCRLFNRYEAERLVLERERKEFERLKAKFT